MHPDRVEPYASRSDDVLVRPNHPYTVALMRTNPGGVADPTQRLHAIPGSVPNLLQPPPGCRFASRCKYVMDACLVAPPPLKSVGPGHAMACILD